MSGLSSDEEDMQVASGGNEEEEEEEAFDGKIDEDSDEEEANPRPAFRSAVASTGLEDRLGPSTPLSLFTAAHPPSPSASATTTRRTNWSIAKTLRYLSPKE